MSLREQIDSFLALKRIAMVGVSRNPKDFSRSLFRDLLEKGYDVVPVNPNAEEIEGKRCFAHVQDIPDPVEGALLMTPGANAEQVVNDCLEAHIAHLWFYRALGQGAISPEALAMCVEKGIATVPGECPYMFLPNTALPHKVHYWFHTAFTNRYN